MARAIYTPPKERIASFVDGENFTSGLIRPDNGLSKEQQIEELNTQSNNEKYSLLFLVQDQ